jgi:hypothetical protein
MLKLVSIRLETQADTTLHVRKCCSQYDWRDYAEAQKEVALSWQVGAGSMFAKFSFYG